MQPKKGNEKKIHKQLRVSAWAHFCVLQLGVTQALLFVSSMDVSSIWQAVFGFSDKGEKFDAGNEISAALGTDILGSEYHPYVFLPFGLDRLG